MTPRPRLALRLLLATAAIGAATLAAALLRSHLAPVNLMMLFLLAVVAAAATLGQGPAVWSALLAVAIFDFFFVPPHLTFAVDDAQYLLTFAGMLVVGLTVSTLTERLRHENAAIAERERRATALWRLGRRLADVEIEEALRLAAVDETREAFAAPAVLVGLDEAGELTLRAAAPSATTLDAGERAAATATLDTGLPSDRSEDGSRPRRGLFLPLPGPQGDVLGALGLLPAGGAETLSDGDRRLLETFASQIALALGRRRVTGDRGVTRAPGAPGIAGGYS